MRQWGFYNDMVTELAKSPTDIMNTMTPQRLDRCHASIGLMTEATELLEACHILTNNNHIVEELGDIEFYQVQFWRTDPRFKIVSSTLESLIPADPPRRPAVLMGLSTQVVIEAGMLLDIVKKEIIYNKPFDYNKAIQCGIRMNHFLNAMYPHAHVTRQIVRQINMNKLGRRYKDGYSDKAAQTRADKAVGQ